MNGPSELDEFFETLPSLKTEDELVDSLARVLDGLGFVAFNYGFGHLAELSGLTLTRIWSTRDPEWIAHYATKGFYREDRLVRAALFRVHPFRYEDIYATPPRTITQREIEMRLEYRSGVTVPIHGPNGTFGVLSASAKNVVHRPSIGWARMAEVQCIGTAFHQRVVGLDHELPISPFFRAPPIALARRENECLSWAAAGKTNRDIAQLLGISPRTVKKHIESAMRKLDAITRGQAIARAAVLNLIEPELRHPFERSERKQVSKKDWQERRGSVRRTVKATYD